MALIDAAHRRIVELPDQTAAIEAYLRLRLDRMDLAVRASRSPEQEREVVAELQHRLFSDVTCALELEQAVVDLDATLLHPPHDLFGLAIGMLTGAAVVSWEISH
ncbi:MAG: hypothetical protein ACYDAQ_10020 [Mycobacteriales bacterium]